MAGIGQRYTSDSHSWNSPHSLNMGRSLISEPNKPFNPFEKRPMLNSSNLASTEGSGLAPSGGVAIGQNQNFDLSNSTATSADQLNSSMFNLRVSNNLQRNGDTSATSQIRSNFLSSTNNNSDSNNLLPFQQQLNPSSKPSLNRPSTAMNDFSVFPSNFISGSNNALTVTSSKSSSLHSRIIGPSVNSLTNNNSNSSNSNSAVFSILDPSDFPPIRPGGNQGTLGNNTLLTKQSNCLNGNNSPGSAVNNNQAKNFLHATSSSKSLHQQQSSETSLVNGSVNSFNSFQNGPEFSIDHDFPALPGSAAAAANSTISSVTSNHLSNYQNNHHSTAVTSQHLPTSHSDIGASQGSNNILQNSNFTSTLSNNNGQSSNLTKIPKNMISDKFGMIGLLKLIRVGDHDATLNMLAPGLDLNSLNIKWDTSDEMFNTFVSPCHDSSTGRPQDIDYPVPSEYLIRQMMNSDYLPDPPLDKLAESTLFWLFYNCCREEIQLVAARELYQRHWRFHTKRQLWLTRVPNENVTVETASEQGYYHYWDRINAKKLKSHMKIFYADLDDTPASFRLSSGLLSASVRLDV